MDNQSSFALTDNMTIDTRESCYSYAPLDCESDYNDNIISIALNNNNSIFINYNIYWTLKYVKIV